MDFSNFSDAQTKIQEQTHILVIDFVNRSCLFSKKINNFENLPLETEKEFSLALEQSINSLQNVKKAVKLKKAA